MKLKVSACSVLFLVCFSSLSSLPLKPRVVCGSARIESGSSSQMQICAADRTVIEWEEFSIGMEECVQIVQPSSEALLLIRTISTSPSALLGSLSANGRVYLVNGDGIVVGKGSRVCAASFLASTLECEGDLQGDDLLFQGDSMAAIEQAGFIEPFEGAAVFIARNIVHNGEVRAEGGQVAFALSSRARMSLASQHLSLLDGQEESLPRGRLTFGKSAVLYASLGRISIEARDTLLHNEGSLLASDGEISVFARGSSLFYQIGKMDVSGECGGKISFDVPELFQLGELFADGSSGHGGAVQIDVRGPYTDIESSMISACGKGRGGKVEIQAAPSSFFSSGKIVVNGDVGGEVFLSGERLTFAASFIDASGTSQGGVIQIDPKTAFVYLNPSTQFKADAKIKGDGGKIEILSAKKTQCYGCLSANGGEGGGNGGFIEISGKGDFFCSGQASAFAKEGEAGTVLFDPHDLIINDTLAIYPQYQLLDPHPDQGTLFGNQILILSNGNVVVTKPWANLTGATHAGAVYLYNGLTGAIISLVTGSQNNDLVGGVPTSGSEPPQSDLGVIALKGNNNFVVRSPNWANGSSSRAGTATWGNGSTGFISQGPVSPSNSLVGTNTGDLVSDPNVYSIYNGIIPLANGNYVVTSPDWNGAKGAATFGNGSTGITGPVTSSNSIVGVNGPDAVAESGVFALTNGNYIVASVGWNHSTGAVTWGNGTTGTSGQVSNGNSLVGQNPYDEIGNFAVPLSNGHYVVGSQGWSGTASGAGAVAWGDGTRGTFGPVTTANSIYGTNPLDNVSSGGIYPLPNGNYVVVSSTWNSSRGAVTWGNGTGPTSAAVSSSNSMVGTVPRADPNYGDRVGYPGIAVLSNGNYVISSYSWNYQNQPFAGAATWCSGTKSSSGVVGPSNSLVGAHAYDQVSYTIDTLSIYALSNGNYVVGSPTWANGTTAMAGAATFGNGATGVSGFVSADNSLVGTTGGDQVALMVTPLPNGHYVVGSPNWNNGAISDAGAATFCNGTMGNAGPVGTNNSLTGSTPGDSVSSGGITALPNGNYVVSSPEWNNGAIGTNYGAVTFCSGLTVGPVSAASSWIGATPNSSVGGGGTVALTNGNYVILSPHWGNDAGAVTLGGGRNGTAGVVSPNNSLFGNPNDLIGSLGVYALSNGNYLILSPQWNNGLSAITPASGTDGSFLVDGTYGALLAKNSIIPEAYNALSVWFSENQPYQSIVVGFLGDGDYGQGCVHIALQSPNQITYQAGLGQNMTVPAGFITQALNKGTSVTLQANNDIVLTLYSPLQVNKLGGAAGSLTLSAGKSVYIGAPISTDGGNLSMIANASSGAVYADRSPGDAYIVITTGTAINVGTGSLSLAIQDGGNQLNSTSALIALEKGSSLTATGNGSISLFAMKNSIQLSSCSMQTQNGSISLIAGESLAVVSPSTLQTTGTGALTLVVDNLNPSSSTGKGYVDLTGATLLAGGPLKIYSVSPNFNTLPAKINNNPILPQYQKGGVYYPNSPLSGTPYALYYKKELSVRKKTR